MNNRCPIRDKRIEYFTFVRRGRLIRDCIKRWYCVRSIKNANASATRAAKDAKNAVPCTIKFRGNLAQLRKAFTVRNATAMDMQPRADMIRMWPMEECPWTFVGNFVAVASALIAQ